MAEKFLRVTMPDGSEWDVPARIIALDYANYYEKTDDEMTFSEHLAHVLAHDDEIEDWASNNMDWLDVVDHAVKVDEPPPGVDYKDGWVNGDKKVVER